jgi:hypothetical protein
VQVIIGRWEQADERYPVTPYRGRVLTVAITGVSLAPEIASPVAAAKAEFGQRYGDVSTAFTQIEESHSK